MNQGNLKRYYEAKIESSRDAMIRDLKDIMEMAEEALKTLQDEPCRQIFDLDHEKISQAGRKVEGQYHRIICHCQVIGKLDL